MPQFLTLDDVLETHAFQIASYGGSEGVRDLGLLESALAQPEAGFGDQYLHADIFEMASAYLYHLVMNHPFIDGNKRVGLESALIFLEIKAVSMNASDDELVDLVLKTAMPVSFLSFDEAASLVNELKPAAIAFLLRGSTLTL